MVSGRATFWRWLSVCLVLSAGPVVGQSLRFEAGGLRVEVPRERVGMGGMVQPGCWTGLGVSLENPGQAARSVICEWVVQDADGDPVHARRAATIGPGETGRLWVYQPLPLTMGPGSTAGGRWRLRVLDGVSGQLLASRTTAPSLDATLSPEVGVIGLTGSRSLGLTPYESNYTQQEAKRLVDGLTIADLPDRWYGMSMLQALVWTPDGGAPDDARITPAAQRSLIEWVRRGGHLVIVLPSVGPAWERTAFAELVEGLHTRTREGLLPPGWLGGPLRDATWRITGQEIEIDPGTDAAVLLRGIASSTEAGARGPALVAAKAFGLGRVTVIGLDLTERGMTRQGLPNGPQLWRAVFGWRSPAYRQDFIDKEVAANRMAEPGVRDAREQGEFIPLLTAMAGRASGVILAAIFFFTLYWVTVGPAGYFVLRRKGLSHQSWNLFVAGVLVATGIAWGGGWLMAAHQTRIEHFSVVDVWSPAGGISAGQPGLLRVQSWFSFLVPRHGRAELALERDSTALSDPGLAPRLGGSLWGQDVWGVTGFDQGLTAFGPLRGGTRSVFVTAMPYALDAAAPWVDATDPERGVAITVRSTARSVQSSCLLSWSGKEQGGTTYDWKLLGLPVTMSRGRDEPWWPSGQLRHQLRGPGGSEKVVLRNVLVVYCPGDGAMPWAAPVGDWASGEPLDLAVFEDSLRRYRLLEPPQPRVGQQKMTPWRGYLGDLMRNPGMGRDQVTTGEDALAKLPEDQTVRMIERLSFYEYLPPPLWDRTEYYGPDQGWEALRTGVRGLDISELLPLRRLIVIGHLPQSPLPLPMTLDGGEADELSGGGWTVVRWIVPISEPSDRGSDTQP
ncbi:MAG: hypothetical protein IT441_03695 [Phycisphaeraceae bacterium]|nr:hypothetical protein [Phycisphaeraceae bacterium]